MAANNKFKNKNPQRKEDNASRFTCQICIEPMAANNKFKNKNLCTHHFCEDCIAKYIHIKVQDNTAKIECPGLDCQQILDPITCKPLIPESPFVKWCDVLCNDYVLGFERNYCSNRNCMVLVVNECGRYRKEQKAWCPNCKQMFCFQCKLAWQAGYRCENTKNLRDPNDIVFRQLVEMITCRCKTPFCYNCGRTYPSQCVCPQKCTQRYCFIVFLLMVFIVLFISSICIYDANRMQNSL